MSAQLVSRVSLCLSLCLALVAGCSDDDSPPDDASIKDASTSLDASVSQDSGSSPGADSGTQNQTDSGVPPDAGVLPDECDPIQQTCTSTGTKCIVENSNPGSGAQCVPSSPQDGQYGDSCAGGDCAGGLVCIRTSSTANSCRKLCDRGTGEGCAGLPVEADCIQSVGGTNWGLCVELPPACDAVTQSPCEPEEACQPLQRFDGSFEMRCRPKGTAQHGEACDTQRCDRGLVCVRQNNQTLCHTVCASGDDTPCPQGSTCSGTINGLDVDYCSP